MKPKRQKKREKTRVKENPNPVFKGAMRVGFILFLLYSSLLMREFTQSESAPGQSLIFAVKDVFSATNFIIGIISALIVYLIFENFRKKL